MGKPDKTRTRRRWPRAVFAALALVYLATATWHVFKPLPDGLNFNGPWRPVSSLRFYADSTWLDSGGEQHVERQIFDAALAMIERAEALVVADFFLVNDFAGQAGKGYRPISSQLGDALISQQRARPALEAALITDPFNDLYGGVQQPLFTRLEGAGVQVVETDLTALRDSNPAWSAAWRLCCQWFGNDSDGGWLPNPVGDGTVTLRTYLALLNFKANHRKTLIVDGENGPEALVTSANPHDASSRHDNIAFAFDGPAVGDLLKSERAVVRFSSGNEPDWPPLAFGKSDATTAEVRVVTEAAIRDAALAMIDSANQDDSLRCNRGRTASSWHIFFRYGGGINDPKAASSAGPIARLRLLNANHPNRPKAPVAWVDSHSLIPG